MEYSMYVFTYVVFLEQVVYRMYIFECLRKDIKVFIFLFQISYPS